MYILVYAILCLFLFYPIIGIDFKHFIKYVLLSLGFTNAAGMLGKVFLFLTANVPITEPSPYFSEGSTLWALLFLTIIPPVTEELFFRKLLLLKLAAAGDGFAIICSSMLFFFYHTLITTFEVHTFVLGIALSYIMLRTRNILYPVLIHVIINLWSVWSSRIMLTLPVPFMLISALISLAIPASMIVIIIMNRRKLKAIVIKILKNQMMESV